MANQSGEHNASVGQALDIFDVDLENYIKFPVLDPSARYKQERFDIRQELKVDPNVDLADYSGPFKADLRFTDFSREQLVRMLAMNDEYLKVWLDAWLEEIEKRYGRAEMLDIEWTSFTTGVVPQLGRMLREFLPAPLAEARLKAANLERYAGSCPSATDRIVQYTGPFSAEPGLLELSKPELATMVLGSHEYLMQCYQGVAAQVVVRRGLDAMFSIQWDIWSAKILPAIKDLKARHMGIDGHDVAAFMKDLQIDASAMPGKAFDLDFEMPSQDVGIMTFNRCPAPKQFEAMGRPDILEKGCHATCPASIIETAKMYNPNMKLDILAIPPRVDDTHVCCKWKLSMRDANDPEYVQLRTKAKSDKA